MRFFVGIDDTDNLESRGTGYRARQLANTLGRAGFEPLGVTRHQLLVDPRIPYTSHNSSACIEVAGNEDAEAELIARSREFLLAESAPGSDAGLCVAATEAVSHDIVDFGRRAKGDVVATRDAERLAESARVHLEGLTGTRIGVIGALAAVGLRRGGNDGRFLWLPRLRDVEGVHEAGWLRQSLRLDAIETEDGRVAADRDLVSLGAWPRPLMRGGRIVLLIQEAEGEDVDWVVAAKERLKQLSE